MLRTDYFLAEFALVGSRNWMPDKLLFGVRMLPFAQSRETRIHKIAKELQVPPRAVNVGRLARLMARSVTRCPMAHEINTALFYWSDEQQLPMANTPDVDVHEVGAAIVPHSSAMQAQGCVTQLRRRNPR